jgi:hypothetical protein
MITIGIWLLHVCLLLGSGSFMYASGRRQLHVCFREAAAACLLQGSGSCMFAPGKRQLHICFKEAAVSCLLQGSGSFIVALGKRQLYDWERKVQGHD